MPTKNTFTKTARLSFCDNMRIDGYLRRKKMTFSGLIREVSRQILYNTFENAPNHVEGYDDRKLEDLGFIAMTNGMTLGELLEDFRLGLDEGHFKIRYRHLRECPFDYDVFVLMCKEVGLEYQDAIDEATDLVREKYSHDTEENRLMAHCHYVPPSQRRV